MSVARLERPNVSRRLASLKEVLTALDLGAVDLREVADRPPRGEVVASRLIPLAALEQVKSDLRDVVPLGVGDEVRKEPNLRAWVCAVVRVSLPQHARLTPLAGHRHHLVNGRAVSVRDRQPRADVGISALRVILPPIACLGVHHEGVILVKDRDGGGAPHAT